MKLVPEILIAGVISGAVAVVDNGVTAPEQVKTTVDMVSSLVEKFGVMFILLAYFVVRDYFRMKSDGIERKELLRSLEAKDTYIKNELKESLERCVREVTKAKSVSAIVIEALKEIPATSDKVRKYLNRDQDDDSTDRIERRA